LFVSGHGDVAADDVTILLKKPLLTADARDAVASCHAA
jgi:hypothetical protein